MCCNFTTIIIIIATVGVSFNIWNRYSRFHKAGVTPYCSQIFHNANKQLTARQNVLHVCSIAQNVLLVCLIAQNVLLVCSIAQNVLLVCLIAQNVLLV